jgi:hypothetical protein
MTADRIAERVHGARRVPRGWSAKCPAHEDSSPSLSISTGADGRTLLNCFRGCSAGEIVTALGLELRDLFARDDVADRRPTRGRRRPTSSDIRDELAREARAFRERHALAAGELLLSHELNVIRSRVAGRLEISLAPIGRPIWEGAYGGRERDPLWPVVFEAAWRSLWYERTGTELPYTLEERARDGAELHPRVRILVERRAAAMMSRVGP